MFTAHSAHVTCAEVCALLTLLILLVLKCVHCSLCSYYLCWGLCTDHSAHVTCAEACALLTLLILLVLKCVHCSLCSYYLCWRYCVWTYSCFLQPRLFTRFSEETASWMTGRSRSSSFYPFKAQWLVYVPPCLILKNLRSAHKELISVFCVYITIKSDYFSQTTGSLGAFQKVQKATTSLVVSACLS